MLPPSKLYLVMSVLALSGFLAACSLNSGSDFTPSNSEAVSHVMKRQYISENKDNIDNILVTVDYIDRPHRVIGNISGYSRSYLPWSSDPATKQVNRALAEEAQSQGADAVMDVDYSQESTMFSDHGRLVGSGVAIVYTTK